MGSGEVSALSKMRYENDVESASSEARAVSHRRMSIVESRFRIGKERLRYYRR